MKLFLLACWSLAGACLVLCAVHESTSAGDIFECKLPFNTGAFQCTQCREFVVGGTTYWGKCFETPDPETTKCLNPATANNQVCEENIGDCTGDLRYWTTEAACDAGTGGFFMPGWCDTNIPFGFTYAQDTGDNADCGF